MWERLSRIRAALALALALVPACGGPAYGELTTVALSPLLADGRTRAAREAVQLLNADGFELVTVVDGSGSASVNVWPLDAYRERIQVRVQDGQCHVHVRADVRDADELASALAECLTQIGTAESGARKSA